MKRLSLLFIQFLRRMCALRYKVEIKGLNTQQVQEMARKGGILFLPNHPTIFIDPLLVLTKIRSWIPVYPVVSDWVYYHPRFRAFLEAVDAIPVPNFTRCSNTYKQQEMERRFDQIADKLNAGEHVLMYPSGRVKWSEKEQLGASSGLEKILQKAPDTQIVLVRTTGLFGSLFSYANGNNPLAFRHMVRLIGKILWKNLLFFCPKRHVTITFEQASHTFPRQASRTQQNLWLESFYNQILDPNTEVSHYFWTHRIERIEMPQQREEYPLDIDTIKPRIRQAVCEKIAQITQRKTEEITPEMRLAYDLGMDSIDLVELYAFLEEQYGVQNNSSTPLTTVQQTIALAGHQIDINSGVQKNPKLQHWMQKKAQRPPLIPMQHTLIHSFLHTCKKKKHTFSCADARSGSLTYRSLLLKTLVLSRVLKKLPGKYLGILLPASVPTTVAIFASYFAKKTPVMLNWTTGSRPLNAAVDITQLQVTLSSWTFLDRLSNVDLGKVSDTLTQLEDLRQHIKTSDKIIGAFLALLPEFLLRKLLKLDQITPQDPAVVLFTSGSEGVPKGVPLTHENIASNIASFSEKKFVHADDIFMSFLPPFHSFGFTAGTLYPILSGAQVIFHPNPLEGVKIAQAIEKWKCTILLGAPTFLKGVLRAGTQESLSSLDLICSGGEKAPQDLFDLAESKGLHHLVIEGYGVTECSPIISINNVGEKHKGVGKPVPGISVQIAHPETHEALGTDQEGMILVSGPNVFHGYLNSSADPFIKKEGKTWYVTGDLGILDSDGFLVISGRLKRFVKIGAEMISLESIEVALLEYKEQEAWPMSAEPILAVTSQEIPGTKPKIFLTTTFPVSAKQVNALLKKSGFSNLVRITQVFEIPKIPLSATGKIQYRQIETQIMTQTKDSIPNLLSRTLKKHNI